MIERGNVYLAKPPLYRIEYGGKVVYAYDDEEKEKALANEKSGRKPVIHRYKGLGEMPAGILKETTMDRAQRAILKITISDAKVTDMAFSRLMGKDASARYEFIKEHSEAFVQEGEP